MAHSVKQELWPIIDEYGNWQVSLLVLRMFIDLLCLLMCLAHVLLLCVLQKVVKKEETVLSPVQSATEDVEKRIQAMQDIVSSDVCCELCVFERERETGR